MLWFLTQFNLQFSMKIEKYKVAVANFYIWTDTFFCIYLTGLGLKDYFVLMDIMLVYTVIRI